MGSNREKSNIAIAIYLKNEWLDGIIIILYVDGSNIIFADCSNNADILDQEYRHYIENQ